MPVQVDVALPLSLDTVYTYLLPDALEEFVHVGSLAVVPVRQRLMSGVVTARTHTHFAEEDKYKYVRDLAVVEPVASREILALTQWMANYYVCGWGEVLRAALPAGLWPEEVLLIALKTDSPDAWKGLPTELRDYLVRHRQATFRGLRHAGLRITHGMLRRAGRAGAVMLRRTLRGPKVKVLRAKYVQIAPPFRSISGLKDLRQQVRGPKQKAIFDALLACFEAGEEEPLLRDVLVRADAARSSVDSLVGKGMLLLMEREIIRKPAALERAPQTRSIPPDYHPSQKTALHALQQAVTAGQFRTFLLHGVTGSGKTEVYMAALNTVLERGKAGLVLVPEIALTPQTVARFRARFGDKVAVIHSRMSYGERFDAWRHIQIGRYSVVVGPRSAILAPLSNIGLIVVDEEHESSYKQQDPAPRYHARDVAVKRAQMEHAVCVLGSATPSLESLGNALDGKYTLLSMKERVPVPGYAAAPLPNVRIIDLGHERKNNLLAGTLSMPLIQAVRERLAREEQIIILQNRRGFAPIYECQLCGFVPQCPNCSVSQTYHKATGDLRCHYCGHRESPSSQCPKCTGHDFGILGSGTQRIEEDLADHFPEARIARMDLDTTRGKDAHYTILGSFGRGEADILVGTQMVAKGLDFERVTLVGVINSDLGLRLPDFRSEERTFQLLMQVAGRAGRAALRGEVLLQTRQPHHEVYQHLVRHDFEGFAAILMQQRAALRYPPYSRVVGIEFKGHHKKTTAALAHKWHASLSKRLPKEVAVLGPEAAFVARVKNQYRYQILIKAPKRYQGLQNDLRAVTRDAGTPAYGYRVGISVDSGGLY